ncbi:MAG: DUF938 domain-containing protein, partial [Candidatus Sedimenticola sp. (ex Thyasira tokunagai)]
MIKPFAESCEQNQEPILSVIKPLFADCNAILEIGSGTGQHAVHFAAAMPHLTWQTSEQVENHAGIELWLDDARLSNLYPPLTLDVKQPKWPSLSVDAVFSANTLHIMDWNGVEATFKGVGQLLEKGGLLVVYGPFNYNNSYTSKSNEQFDGWLKSRNPQSGIRNFEDLDRLAKSTRMELQQDSEMPANNRILCWRR